MSERVLLAAIVAAAAWLRFAHLELCEFKPDELNTFREVLRLVEGPTWPLVGLSASIGVRMPPILNYVLAPPAIVDPSPLMVTGWVALLGTVAIPLLYGTLRSRFGSGVALMAAALAASSPWTVLYSRKIWSPDLMFVVSVPLLHCLLRVMERRRTPLVSAVPPLAVALAQLHLSGVPALGVAAGILLWRWRALDRMALAVGLVLALAMCIPYAVFESRVGWVDLRMLWTTATGGGRMAHGGVAAAALSSVARTLDLVGVGGWEFVTGGSQAAWKAHAGPVDVLARGGGCVVAAAMLLGGAGTCLQPRDRRRLVLVAWILSVWAFFGVLRMRDVHRHYLAVTTAAAFALAALGFDDLRRAAGAHRRRLAAGAAAIVVTTVAVVYACFVVRFFGFVAAEGGTTGDYGVAFASKRATARYALCHGLEVRPASGIGEIRGLMLLDRAHGGADRYCEALPDGPGGFLVTRNLLHDAEPLPCPPAELLRFGPIAACRVR